MMRYKSLQREFISSKEFLKAKEVAILLDCSVRTVYYYIDQCIIEASNIGQRMTRIKRSSLDKLLNSALIKNKPTEEKTEIKQYILEDCISTLEVREKYGISASALSTVIHRNQIPRIRSGKYAYVPKELIENLFLLYTPNK